MPVFLIGGGGALIGTALNYEIAMLVWVGLAMVAAGILWGLFLFFWATGGDW